MKNFKVYDVLIGILFTLFFVNIGVIFVINFRTLYYLDVQFLDIPTLSGFSREVIIENYNALIDYCSPFFKGPLTFPTLSASPSGLKHFEEVKDIFVSFYYLLPITILSVIAVVIYKWKKHEYQYLVVSSLTVLVLPLIIAIGTWINFDELFIIFHKIFFRNDLWLFDPSTDPVIQMLPDTFFMHSALVIVGFVMIGSLILYLIYRFIKRKNTTKSTN